MKQAYIVIRDVLRVHGSQTFCIEAESYEEAAALVCAGKGEFDYEEIEVQELSDHCEVSLPDDCKSTRIEGRKACLPNAKDQAAPTPCDLCGGTGYVMARMDGAGGGNRMCDNCIGSGFLPNSPIRQRAASVDLGRQE